MLFILLGLIKTNQHCTVKMSTTFNRAVPTEKSSKILKTSKKQVRFEYVETRYYQRNPCCTTDKPGIKLGAEYEPFETTRLYFYDKHACADCIMKKQKEDSLAHDNAKEDNVTIDSTMSMVKKF